MRRILLSCILALTSATLATSCGDNSKQCGEGTADVDGVCMGMGGGNNCGEGTVDVDGTCVPAEEACADGETAVEGACAQIDLEEGAEPNGEEDAASPAGVIALPAVGADKFTANGCINNHPTASNTSPDFDRYLVTVTEPTLVKLAVDGRGGMVGGFLLEDNEGDTELAGFQRFGLNVASDMSRRQVYLPKAGTYAINVADTRTLMPIITGGTLPSAGNPDGMTSCYLLHAETQTLPAPSTIPADGPATGMIGEDVVTLTGAFGDGYNSVTASMSPAGVSSPSLVVMDTNRLSSFTVPENGGNAFFGGILDGDTPLLVLDPTYNYTLETGEYQVTIDFMMDSIALNRDGTPTAATPSKGQFIFSNGYVLENANLFHWDVDEANTSDGFDLSFNIPMAGFIANQAGIIGAPFAASLEDAATGGPSASVTFTNYVGLIRNDTPGTYYLFLYAPRNPIGTDIIATSTITTLPETPIVPGTPLADQMPNAFNSNPYRYDAGAEDPWHQLNATGTGTGALNVALYPVNTPGRFDSLNVQVGSGTGTPDVVPRSTVPALSASFPEAGTAPVGYIFKNPTSADEPNQTEFFVHVKPTTETGDRQFTLDFKAHPTVHNFGELAMGSMMMVTDEPLTAEIPERRYYVEAPPGSTVTVTVHPEAPPLEPVLAFVDNDESEKRVIDTLNADETFTFTQDASGYSAFVIRSPVFPTTDQAFTLTVKVDPPIYAMTSGATQFADVCATGTIHPSDDPGGDEGLTAPIPIVAGFDFLGAPSPVEFIASTNGFLSFDPNIVNPDFSPAQIPDAVGQANIAPLWTDVDVAQICSKIDGMKQTVQWTGVDYFTRQTVEIQVIIDAADDSLEFVYGAGHQVLGPNSSAGAQNLGGYLGVGTGAFSPFVTPGASVKLTP